MNKIPCIFALLLLSSILFTSCKKDTGSAPGPAEAEGPVTGYLCTIGVADDQLGMDTLVYYGGAYVQRFDRRYKELWKDDRVTLHPGASTILTRVNPIESIVDQQVIKYSYLGCYQSNYLTGERWGVSALRPSRTEDCEHTLTRSKDNRKLFHLESKKYPGYFLTTAGLFYDYVSNRKHTHLVYEKDNPRTFFILAE
jgi:hypothetical protein